MGAQVFPIQEPKIMPTPKRKGFFRIQASFGGLLEALAMLVLAASLLTPWDFLSWRLEQLVHFKWQYLAAALGLGLWCLVARRWRLAAALAVAVAVNAAYVWPWTGLGPRPAVAGTGPSLKLLLANLYFLNEETSPFLALVRREQPDLVVAIEVTEHWTHALEKLEADWPYRLARPREDPFGIAVLSRRPWREGRILELGSGQPPSVHAVLELEGRAITLLATHPLPPENHAWWQARNRQLADAARLLRETPGPTILAGDLNVSLWSWVHRALEEESGLRNARLGLGLFPTWPQEIPPARIPLDHFLISRHFAVEDLRTGPAIGSDHLPLILRLRLTGDSPAESVVPAS